MENVPEIFSVFKQIVEEEISNKNHLLLSPRNRFRTKMLLENLVSNISSNYIDENEFIKLVVNMKLPMPLESLWYLQVHHLFYLGSYVYFHPDQAKKLPELLVQLACLTNDKNLGVQREDCAHIKQIYTDFFIELLICIKGPQIGNISPSFQTAWLKTSSIIWQSIRRRFLSMLLNQIEEFNINYLKELRERNVLTDRVIQEVYMDHLHTIVKHKPYVKVQMAIQHQSSWIKANLDKNILNMFTEIIQYISSPLDELVIIMKEEEISWKWCLIAASICLDIDPNSQKLKIIIDNLIHRAFDKSDADYLLISFLLVRQASYENLCGFDSYSTWFSIKFGIDSIGPPSKDHASFKFLIGFLSSIIPYESEEILKMHLEKSFAAPPGSMSLIKEYKSLIQTRLSDINQEASQLH